jgi:hypothetical protein
MKFNIAKEIVPRVFGELRRSSEASYGSKGLHQLLTGRGDQCSYPSSIGAEILAHGVDDVDEFWIDEIAQVERQHRDKWGWMWYIGAWKV